jgi:hypothetical protein
MNSLDAILEKVSSLSIAELDSLRMVCIEEISQRTVDNSDTGLVIASAFEFFPSGLALEPYIKNGFLVAIGYKYEKGKNSHSCSFLNVGSNWVWEHPDKIQDMIKGVPGKAGMRSVTLLPALEGLELDQITMKMRSGVHEVKTVSSFQIINGSVVKTASRNRTASKHR